MFGCVVMSESLHRNQTQHRAEHRASQHSHLGYQCHHRDAGVHHHHARSAGPVLGSDVFSVTGQHMQAAGKSGLDLPMTYLPGKPFINQVFFFFGGGEGCLDQLVRKCCFYSRTYVQYIYTVPWYMKELPPWKIVPKWSLRFWGVFLSACQKVLV